MDKERRCANKCIFCFVTSCRRGCAIRFTSRTTTPAVPFAGNYITLTNLSKQDIDRLVSLRLSPVNISVHTMNPELRVRMTGNPRAAELTGILRRFYERHASPVPDCALPGHQRRAELRYTMDELKNCGRR